MEKNIGEKNRNTLGMLKLLFVKFCKSKVVLLSSCAHLTGITIKHIHRANCFIRFYASEIAQSTKHAETSGTYKNPRVRKPLSKLDIDTRVPNDTVLYSKKGMEFKCTIISSAGVFCFFGCGNSASLVYSFMKQTVAVDKSDKFPWYYWWRYVDFNNTVFKVIVSSLMIGVGSVVLYFSMVYPSRFIRVIKLLKGGEQVFVETYGPFGIKRSRTILLKDVSAQWADRATEKYFPLKIRGKKLNFLVFQDGEFFNRHLFNQTVGLYRKFSN